MKRQYAVHMWSHHSSIHRFGWWGWLCGLCRPGQAFSFFLAFYPSRIFSLAAERTFHAVSALETFVSIIIQSVDCWAWGLQYMHIRCVSSLCQWPPGWLQKLREHTQHVTRWYHVIPLGLALPRSGGAFQLFTFRLEGRFVMGCQTWWHRMACFAWKWRCYSEPRWRQVKFGFQNISMMQTKIAALQNCHLGSSCTETPIWLLRLK